MSYDLVIRPKTQAASPQVGLEAVSSAVIGAGASPVEGGDGTFELTDRTSGIVEVDLETTGPAVVEVRVSAATTTAPPRSVYLFCAAVAGKLDWEVFDPQGDTTYSQAELAAAGADDSELGDSRPVGLVELLGEPLFLVVAVVWLLKGARPAGTWFTVLTIALAIVLANRVRGFVKGRRGGVVGRRTRG